MTKTPNLLSVSNDEAFIYLSGATIIGSNVGTGVGVYKGLSGNTLQFRKLSGSGNTTITQVGDTIYISSTGGGSTGGTGTITGGTNGLSVSGANIKLGGILNQHTQINGVAVYNLDLCNINEFKASTAGVTTLFGVDNTGILMSVTGGSVSLEDNGGMKYAADYSANYTDRSLIDKGYLQSQIVSGSTYNLSSPAAITVGGITGGTVLTGKTSFQLFEELLVPTLYPTLTPPSNTIGISPSGTFEVGCIIPTVVITSTFNAGCINPQYSAACDKRSNGAYLHEFDGCQVTGSYVCPSLSVSKCAFSYLICSGAQTWCTHVHYSGGTQPKNNKGGNYCAPLPAGETACQNASLTGIYPYYYGKLTSGGRPPVTNALVTVGCIGKVVASSTGTVTVTFGSNSSEYTWLAIPQTSTSKTCWYVNALDNGCVNSAPSDKYPDECIIAITSAESCWVGVNYKVYMSGTVGAISAPIQFRN